VDPANPYSDGSTDMDGPAETTVKLKFGSETLHDDDMQLLGIVVNTDHKLVICVTCHSAITPSKLYDHVRLPDHHKRDDFKKDQRLAFATREFFDKLVSHHCLGDPRSKRPNTIVPAIPGLAVRKKMFVCKNCSYAVKTRKRAHIHRGGHCPGSKILKGPAQTFLLSSNRDYFGVKLPRYTNPNPLDPALLFHKQFASNPYADIPVDAAAHPREMNVFLATATDWLIEVDGMTGRQITDLARHARPDLRKGVKGTVSRYVLKAVSELRGTEGPMRLAIGDYNK